MAGLFNQGREALGNIGGESARILLQVEDWRAQIATLTTAEELNRAIVELKKLPPIAEPQVKKLLWDHAKAKSIPFDKSKACFVEPVVATA